MSLSENMGILQKSPLALMELCILPSYPAEEFQCFLSLPISLFVGVEEELACGAPRALPVVSPNP